MDTGTPTGTPRAEAPLPVPVPDPERAARDERLVRRRFWDVVRGNLHRVPFLADALAAFYCLTDPRTPATAKAVLAAALAYFVMPFDAVPDWLLALGFVDDGAVVLAAVQAVRAHLLPEHHERARTTLEAERARAEAAWPDAEEAA